ncbi:TPA: hypothetical protein PXN47_003805 [Yersinia enterocolitica]|nr:hypothetical protein [Yersinia enterocolitica]
MDADLISFEAMIATRESADWAMWGVMAAGVAAIGSILTLFYAVAALSTWKKQEKTKIKSEFKKSLLALDYATHLMPDEWDGKMAQLVKIKGMPYVVVPTELNEAGEALDELKKCWHSAISAWVMCEGLLKETNLPRLWNELSDIYLKYIQGLVNKQVILKKLAEMHSIQFIFD